jgi:lactate dehydrogenase-like 2-hydroxyacid dehydrogenase
MPEVKVLLVGKLHPRIREILSVGFKVVTVQGGDWLELSSDTASSIRGVAVVNHFPGRWLDQLPNCEIVASFGVGYDGVDVGRAAARQVVVTNTPDVLNDEVADTTIGLLLNAVRDLSRAEYWLREGKWKTGVHFPLSRFSLQGRHIGLYGLGRIGREIARRLVPFKVKISYHTRTRQEHIPYDYYPSLAELAEAVDTLIAIVPKTPETHRRITAEILKALGPDGIFINVGRGWTVDEEALAQALSSGVLGAAALDVYYDEPNVPQGLLNAPNTVLLPHVGSASVPTRRAMAELVANNIVSWFANGAALTPVAETPQRSAARLARRTDPQ